MLTATGANPVIDIHPDKSFMLGNIKVSPSHNTLWVSDQSVKLQPKAMAVLQYLAINHRRVISNEELIQHVWSGRVVTHGSVQKSINSLRSGLSELAGDQEFIAHYSKRGYQLTIEPEFLTVDRGIEGSTPKAIRIQRPLLGKWFFTCFAIILPLVVITAINGVNWYSVYLPMDHKVTFATSQGYTSETGHEHNPTPHPDNQQVAYIREAQVNGDNETRSEIIIRNAKGKDWTVAGSTGSWYKLAWSPSGNSLVAIEMKRREGTLAKAQFYQPPNHLYSFHIFTLDFAQQRIVEKQQLSQWQGHISSVSWWDEDTLEIVAKQGPNSGNGRYRYSILNQQLNLLDEYEGARNPLVSATFEKKTAIASAYKNKTRIDFLDAKQRPISRLYIDVSAPEISWIPDGSGVLVYAEEERKLFTAYLNGKQNVIPLSEAKDKIVKQPHYRADGNAIYYTEEKRSSNILIYKPNGLKERLTENTDLNYAASFSPDGEKIVYASVRNNQIHLWLVQNGQESQLTSEAIPAKVGTIIWSDDGKHLVFNSGNQVYHYNFLANHSELITSDDDNLEPLAYLPEENILYLIKHKNGMGNLWKIDEHRQKQLTFGAVGSAIGFSGSILFQYISENGLWALRKDDESLEQITPHLEQYSKLLKADALGFYYMSGGICHESDIYYQNYASDSKTVFLEQQNNNVLTTSFNEKQGLLQTECYLPEANIMYMQ